MTTFNLNQGALAPLSDEFDILSIDVTGDIPVELNGALLRNGPNPLNGRVNDIQDLDASDIEQEPQAIVHLPHRVPAGFHASWIPFD